MKKMTEEETQAAQTETPPTEEDAPKKGVKTKIFGVILIVLGVLNSMLSFRGGFEISSFQNAILVTGVVLYIIGVVRSGES